MDSEIKLIYCLLLLGLNKKDQEKILSVPDKMFSKEAAEVIKKCKSRMINNELIDYSIISEKERKIGEKIFNTEAFAERIDLYIKELKHNYIKRKLQEAAVIETNEELLNEISSIREEMLGESQTVKKLSLKNVVEEYYKNIENPPKNPLKTGWKKFDGLAQMEPEDLVVVEGRPGMGKTAFILSQALSLAKNSNKGIFFSLEMSEKQVINRIMAQMSRISLGYLKSTEGFGKLKNEAHGRLNLASTELAKLGDNLNIITGNFTVNKILEICKIEKEKNDLDYIIIDYMQLLGSNVKGGRYEQVTDISISLKKLAKELGIVVIALAQLSREVEKRVDKHPLPSDLRDSGQIEQDASIIIGLYREAYYVEDADPELLEVSILKNRNGGLGTIYFNFKGEIQEVKER
jgi:replicative DNA helicase